MKIKYGIGAMLVLAMLLVTVFAPSLAADTREKNPLPLSYENLKELEKFVDPVTIKVREMKAKGMSDDEIVKALEPLEMGYYPPTGATWIGRSPTPEEAQKLPPKKYPFKDVTPSIVPSASILSWQSNQVMETVYDQWSGFTNYLKPGTLEIKTGESTLHLATTHIGAGGHWTEGGVFRWLDHPEYGWQKFTYDDDEGGWKYHGSTSATTYTKFRVVVSPTLEPAGYKYNIWINDIWVRSGHLPYYVNNDVNQANEVWSETNKWTPDNIFAEHKDPYLLRGTVPPGVFWWNASIATNWWHVPDPCPVKEYHYISGSAWLYLTYVG